MAVDGSLNFDTKIDSKGFNKGTSNLGKSLNLLKGKMSGIFNPFSKGAASAQNSITGLRSSFMSFAKVAAGAFAGVKIINFGKEAIESASDLAEAQNVVDVSFGKSSEKMEKFAETCVETYGISKLTAKQTGSVFAAMGSGMGLSEDAATDMAVALTGLSADMASFYNVKQDIASIALKSIYTGETETLKQFGVVMTEANLEAYALSQGIQTSYREMSQAEKVQLRYNYVMQQTSLAQGDFARTSNGWANQTRMLSEKWKEFSTVIGGVLMNVLLPAVRTLNGAMSQLIKVAQNAADALASVFGIEMQSSSGAGAVASSTAEVADSSSEAADNYSEMASNAKKAEKANKGSLASFDKLNTLSKKSDDSKTGSFALPTATSPTVDTGKAEKALKDLDIKGIQDILKDFGSKINDFFRNVDWKGIGSNLGSKINDVLSVINTALTSVDWKLIGASLAQGLNGIISAVDWDLLGQTVGNKMNVTIGLLDGFISNFDWATLGTSLATYVTSLFNTIDWQGVVNIIVNGLNGVATTLYNFVNNIDWTKLGTGMANRLNQVISGIDWALIGQALGDSVQGVIDTAYSFVTTYDWGSFASGISTSINEFFSSIDWSKAGKTVGEAIKGLFTEIGTFLGKVDWNKIGQDIGTFLSNIDWAGIFDRVMTAIGNAISGSFGTVKGIVQGLASDGVSPLEGAFIGLAGTIGTIKIGSTFVSEVKKGINSIKDFAEKIKDIPNKINKFVGEVKNGISKIGEFASKIKDGATKLAEFAQNIATATTNIIKNTAAIIKNKIGEFASKIKDGAAKLASFAQNIATATVNIIKNTAAIMKNIIQLALQKAALIAQKVATVATSAAQGALNLVMSMNPISLIIIAITALIGVFVLLWNKCEGFREFWKNLWDKVKEIAGVVWEAIKGFFVGAWNVIKGVWSKVKEFFSKVWQGIKNVFSGVVAWFKNIFTNAFNAIKTAFSKVKEFFSNIWSRIKTVFSNVGTWFKEKFTAAINGIKNVFGAIGEWFSNRWSDIKNVFSGIGTWFKNIFSGAWNGIKEIWSKVANWFSDHVTKPIKSAFSKMWSGIKGIINAILGGIESFINFFISGINLLIKGLNKVSFDVPDWVPAIGGKKFGFNLKTLGEVELPRLATGTVVPANFGEFTAVLGDNKREPEVVSPVSTIKQALLEALKESGVGNGSTNIVIEASGNESEIIKYLTFKIKREEKRQGTNNGNLVIV